MHCCTVTTVEVRKPAHENYPRKGDTAVTGCQIPQSYILPLGHALIVHVLQQHAKYTMLTYPLLKET